MNIHDENEIKKEFQLERLIFFSDAVFAIIITIMILDVKLPEALVHPNEEESKQAFLHILPKLIAYVLSFFTVGTFWMRHIRIFSFLKDYNMQLIAINLMFLFSISLFPFALSFIFTSNYIMQYTWGIFIYIGIIYLAFFAQTMLIGYLIRNQEVLCLNIDRMETALAWKVSRVYFISVPLLFILMGCVLYFRLNPVVVYGTLIAQGAVIGILKRHHYPHKDDETVTLVSLFRKAKAPKHPQTINKIHK